MSHFDYICVTKPGGGEPPADPHYGTYYWVSGEDLEAQYSNGTYGLIAIDCAEIIYWYIDPTNACANEYWAKGPSPEAIEGTFENTGGGQQALVIAGVTCGDWSSSSSSSADLYLCVPHIGGYCPEAAEGTYNYVSGSISAYTAKFTNGTYDIISITVSRVNRWYIIETGQTGIQYAVARSNTQNSVPADTYYDYSYPNTGSNSGVVVYGQCDIQSSSSESTASSQSSSSESTQSSASSQSSQSTESSESSENVWTLIGYLCVEINGSNTKNHYLPLYSHSTQGYSESDRNFYGDIVASPTNLVEDGFISNVINGTTYWLHIYTADPSTSCCTNLQGTWRPI